MKKKSLCLLSVLLAYVAQANVVVTNAVLCETDIVGIKIKESFPLEWWSVQNETNNLLENPGLVQYLTLKGIQARIHYAEFSTAELALRGIKCHQKNVAAIFTKGMWDGAAQQKTGDYSWYSENGWGDVLLIVSGTTCFQVSCLEGEKVLRKRICEQIALKIVEKIQKGGRVIMPEEKP